MARFAVATLCRFFSTMHQKSGAKCRAPENRNFMAGIASGFFVCVPWGGALRNSVTAARGIPMADSQGHHRRMDARDSPQSDFVQCIRASGGAGGPAFGGHDRPGRGTGRRRRLRRLSYGRSDSEIADVTNYLRNSFGNSAPLVTADRVGEGKEALITSPI
jgi:hypothetical protein